MNRILVIDDDASVRALVRHYLEGAGYEVMTAENGVQGVGLYRKKPASLVIVDIFMPDKDGIETILELKAAAPGCPVLAMSGGGEIGGIEYLSYAKTLGADDILHKPFSKHQLLAAVEKML